MTTARRGDTDEVVRHEEVLDVATRVERAGAVHARTRVEDVRAEQVVDVGSELADMERAPVAEGDSGQVEVLEDGSVSIPVFEERLVVTKELVVRERVIVRKRTITEPRRVTADLRREHVDVDVDESVEGRVTGARRG
jgi:uncharacterized protein (TIGR02271 family)